MLTRHSTSGVTDKVGRLGVALGFSFWRGCSVMDAAVARVSHVRFSIDLRTVHVGDVAERRGARNVDSQCTGTTMGDYLRVSDLAHVPEELIAVYDTPKPAIA